jgi:hypothetical protein
MNLQMNDSTTPAAAPKGPRPNGRRGQLRMVQLRPVDDKYARAQARGWNDVVAGNGFRDDYDGWKRKVQWAYERGRQQATLAKLHLHRGGAMTVWKRTEVLNDPLFRAVSVVRAHTIIEECAGLARRAKKKKRNRSVS